MNIDEIKESYLKFPDKSDFIPLFEDDKVVFYYVGEDGFKKAKILAFNIGIQAKYQISQKEFILEKLEEYYSDTSDEFDDNEISMDNVSDILSASYEDAPVIKLVNQIIISAVKQNASDMHFESMESFFSIRYRIDGKLRNVKKFPKSLHDTVIARIKVMSMLDVAESRKPQDGRINLKIGNRDVDMRVSVVPSIYGEKAVLRILEKSKNLMNLKSIGFSDELAIQFKKYLSKPNGIILVTGPTGSGKTTTLYASLLEIDREEKNIMTIEDPVEYNIDGITQVQVNPAVNLDFASAVRSFLRQDPDVMLVGEIRDEETAKTAIQASLTGHLVLSTLHTNDAPTAVTRLIEMDIEPFLISSSLSLVVAQRLVRRICPHCKEEVKAESIISDYFKNHGYDLVKYDKGAGCSECFDTGYRGRISIFELLEINDEIRKQINHKGSAQDIADAANRTGYLKMVNYGYDLITQGITTPEEIISVTGSI